MLINSHSSWWNYLLELGGHWRVFSLRVEEKEEEAEEEEEKEEAEEEEEEEEEVVCASPARPADRRLSQPSVSGEGPAGRAPPAPPRQEGRAGDQIGGQRD